MIVNQNDHRLLIHCYLLMEKHLSLLANIFFFFASPKIQRNFFLSETIDFCKILMIIECFVIVFVVVHDYGANVCIKESESNSIGCIIWCCLSNIILVQMQLTASSHYLIAAEELEPYMHRNMATQ